MPITDCRDETKREQLVRDFEIIPLTHVRLFNGQTKKSCAGPTLDREYYVFSYQNYVASQDKGTFICGITVANDFINLIRRQNPAINRLPLFDPLVDFGQIGNANNLNQAGTGRGDRQVPDWDPIAKELYDAIGMICLMWNLPNVGGVLESVLRNLVNNPAQVPTHFDIRRINTIVHKYFITGNPPRANLALCFQDFMIKQNVNNPPLIPFPYLTNHFNQNVVNQSHPTPYFN
jgi:hypothetical protein